jgi:hypothetical protein
MNGYSFLHFYIQETNLCNTEKKELMFICQKLDARTFFYLVGIEVFSKLFHLMCHLLKSDKKKQDTTSKVFRQSPGICRKFWK